MRHDLYLRRQRTLDLYYRNQLDQEHVEKLAKEFNVKPYTIWNDWARRDIWLPQMAQIEQTRTQILMLFNRFSSTQAKALKIFDAAAETKNYNAAIGALKLVLEVDVKEATLRQSLGVMERVPVEYKVERIQNIKKAVVFLVKKVEKENPALLPELLKIVKNVKDAKKIDEEFLEKGR